MGAEVRIHKVYLFTGEHAQKRSLDGESLAKYFKHKEAPPATGDLSVSPLVHLPGNQRAF